MYFGASLTCAVLVSVHIQAASRERKLAGGAATIGLCPRSRPQPPRLGTNLGQTEFMATYLVNKRAVAKARDLIDARQYRVRSRWADVQPRAAEQNAFLKAHGWAEYASWHLALTDGAPDETKARYAFVFGDFQRLHRMGLIACYYRAAEWEHTEVMRAAHNLLLYLDKSRT
jgi:hypothetical protein